MGHVGFVIPWVYHFISRLCSLHYRIKNQRFITVNDTYMKDLELMKDIQAKTKNGTYSHSEHPTGCTIQIRAQLGSGDTATKGMHGIFMSQPTSNFK